MTSTEQKIFNIINRSRNKAARVQYIAKYSGMSSNYVNLVCQGLCRRGHINFMRGLALIPASADVSTVSPPEPPAEERDTQEESPVSNEPVSPVSSEEEGAQENPSQALSISSLEGISSELVKVLEGSGCATIENLAETPVAKLISLGGMDLKQAADFINQARRKLGMIA